MMESNSSWTDKAKACVIICIIPLAIWIAWQQTRSKVSPDEIAAMVATKLKHDDAIVDYQKIREITKKELAVHQAEETVLAGTASSFKPVTLAEFKKELETSKCTEGIEGLTMQFDLCLHSRDAYYDLSENRKLQLTQITDLYEKCDNTLKVTDEQFQTQTLALQECQEKSDDSGWGIYAGLGWGVTENQGILKTGFTLTIGIGVRLLKVPRLF